MKTVFRLLLCALCLMGFTLAGPVHAISADNQPFQGSSSVLNQTVDEIPVIFLHDGAPDDISAMLYISKVPQIKIIGVVMSYGEQHPKKASSKWLSYLYGVLGLESVPLAVGSETPLDPARFQFPQSWRTIADQFWNLPLPKVTAKVDDRKGSQLIIDLVKASPKKVTILSTGALSDMAIALASDPSIQNNISQVVIMGGAFNQTGNLANGGVKNNESAEWNIYVDALAAKQVFNSGVALTIVPLDGSDDFWIAREMYSDLISSNDEGVTLLRKLWEKQFDLWKGNFKLWDIVAAAAIVHPEIFSWTTGKFDVITATGNEYGKTVKTGESSSNRFASGCDFDKLKIIVTETFLEQKTQTGSSTATLSSSDQIFRDDFNGSIGPGWQWLKEDKKMWSLSNNPGWLEIIARSPVGSKNYLLRKIPEEDFELETKMRFEPEANYQFSGLIIYYNTSNYIMFGRAFVNGNDGFYMDHVKSGKFIGENFATTAPGIETVFLRLKRDGDAYTSSYSEDGSHWVNIGTHTSNMEPKFIGLAAGQSSRGSVPAQFDYFVINKTR